MAGVENGECETCRETLSARLDGEDQPGEAKWADRHLAGCPACARWLDDAARVTRLTRLTLVRDGDLAHSGLHDHLRSAVRGRGWGQRQAWAVGLRWALGALGAVQFVLGMVQLSALSADEHAHVDGVSPTHLFHESAAWNFAVGAAFAWIALRRTRPAGLIPMLTAFVVMLVLLSGGDLWLGRVDGARLLSHGFILAGYLVLLALARVAGEDDPPAGRRSGAGPLVARPGIETVTAPTPLRLVPRVHTDRAA